MQLSQSLRLSETPKVAFVGSGGKTTAISILAKELAAPVLITTTTHLGVWQANMADRHIIIRTDSDLKRIDPDLNGITLITGVPEAGRLTGLNIKWMDSIFKFSEIHDLPLLIESDGSRQLPIKAPGINEPGIPDFVDSVVVATGMSGIGKPLGHDLVHHPEIYSDLTDLQEGDTISITSQAKLLAHGQGGLKNIPPLAKKILLLNQADTISLQSQAGILAHRLDGYYEGIIVAELNKNRIHAVFEPTAAIILAAGPSSRYGSSKPVLDYHGIPFIRSIALSAINANLRPIIVITGANAETVRYALNDLSEDIKVIHNPDWEQGQSTSIRSGIDTVLKIGKAGSAIFLLTDLPQVTPAILRALVEEHSLTLSPIIAPLIDSHRGNPVIFDRITFPELVNLQGDIGGRGIFPKFPPVYIPWNDISLLKDVDTPADYEALMND